MSSPSADLLTAALVPAYLLAMLTGQSLARGLVHLGWLSEQILQGRRLPTLKYSRLNIHDHPPGPDQTQPRQAGP
ncbi:MAG: hypothetical protein KGQ93_09080 [Cyanobacteria bacterium REEB459]|nr:hypothetical protein [Cyanobacteria bacterium REEB459]